MNNYYDVLGVNIFASKEEIKRAYKKLAMSYHPDRSTGDEDKFKMINEAYSILSNDEKRREYDLQSLDSSYSFNKTRARPRRENTTTVTMKVVSISLKDAYNGKYMTIDNSAIFIPPGVRNGTTIFSSNMMIKIIVAPDKKFKRSGDDLLVTININAIEAMLGMDVTLEHLDGSEIKFKLSPGIQHGQVINISGKGMKNPEFAGVSGNLLVKCNIEIPKGLTEEERSSIMHLPHRKSITY